ncbi:MAG: hypothetical protein EBX05_07525, partial [Rhodobacteraceae bacterium]|nr:hypothetical protein [Paracoccaceae bacterium]
MFAIAIKNNFTGELYLIRDRLGIKPLYFYLVTSQTRCFSQYFLLLSF